MPGIAFAGLVGQGQYQANMRPVASCSKRTRGTALSILVLVSVLALAQELQRVGARAVGDPKAEGSGDSRHKGQKASASRRPKW